MIPTEDLVELLPCPFCGSDAMRSTRFDEDISTHNTVEYTQISCTGCDVSFEWPSEGYHDEGQDPSIPLAVHQWNTRAEPTLATEVLSSRKRIAELEGEIARVRVETLEEAAKVAEARLVQLGLHTPEWWVAQQIVTAIRSLKDATP